MPAGCRRPTAGGRSRSVAFRRVMTRPDPSTPRPRVLESQNLPCPRIDDGPYIQKNHMGVSIVHYCTHDRTYIGRADLPTPARGGATGTIGASDLVVRSIPRPTTTDDSRSRLEGDKEERKTRLARADAALARATEETRARGGESIEFDRIAREFDRIESLVNGRARWRDARR